MDVYHSPIRLAQSEKYLLKSLDKYQNKGLILRDER